MIHQRQRLSLGFKPRGCLLGIHPGLMTFKRHATTHRLGLVAMYHATAAFAELLEKFVATDAVAGLSASGDSGAIRS